MFSLRANTKATTAKSSWEFIENKHRAPPQQWSALCFIENNEFKLICAMNRQTPSLKSLLVKKERVEADRALGCEHKQNEYHDDPLCNVCRSRPAYSTHSPTNSPVTMRHENLIKRFLLIFFSSHIRVSRSPIERGFNAVARSTTFA